MLAPARIAPDDQGGEDDDAGDAHLDRVAGLVRAVAQVAGSRQAGDPHQRQEPARGPAGGELVDGRHLLAGCRRSLGVDHGRRPGASAPARSPGQAPAGRSGGHLGRRRRRRGPGRGEQAAGRLAGTGPGQSPAAGDRRAALALLRRVGLRTPAAGHEASPGGVGLGCCGQRPAPRCRPAAPAGRQGGRGRCPDRGAPVRGWARARARVLVRERRGWARCRAPGAPARARAPAPVQVPAPAPARPLRPPARVRARPRPRRWGGPPRSPGRSCPRRRRSRAASRSPRPAAG